MLLFFTIACIAAVVGPFVGYVVGSSQKDNSDLTKSERQELRDLRLLMVDVSSKAAERAVMGDYSAVIITNLINDHRKKFS